MPLNSYGRKIYPQNIFDSHGVPKVEADEQKEYFKDLHFIRKSFYLVACVFTFNSNNSPIRELKWKLIEISATSLLVIYVIGDLRNLFNLPHLPVGLTVSTCMSDFCCVALRFVLIWKRGKISATMMHLQKTCYLASRSSGVCIHRYRNRKPHLLAGFCLGFVVPAGLFWHTIHLCSPGSENILEIYVKEGCFGWSSGNRWINCFIQVFLDVLVLNQQYVLPGFGIVLCCYNFGVLKRLVGTFGTAQQNMRNSNWISKYLRYSESVFNCLAKVEESFSLLVLVIYGYMACSIFTVTTFLMRVDIWKAESKLLIPQIISVFVVLVGFYIMTARSVAVNSIAIQVKERVHKIVTMSELSDNDKKLLLLTIVNDFPSKMVLTGWGLFNLNRNFTQRTVSGMITYGLLLSQLGK